jgi:ABC-type cobalamin/Fe3+-siderophores transport system ATPase subunit
MAVVGYTNAGKSTLLNSLTRAQVLAEDKLFATLDPTTRRLALPAGACQMPHYYTTDGAQSAAVMEHQKGSQMCKTMCNTFQLTGISIFIMSMVLRALSANCAYVMHLHCTSPSCDAFAIVRILD